MQSGKKQSEKFAILEYIFWGLWPARCLASSFRIIGGCFVFPGNHGLRPSRLGTALRAQQYPPHPAGHSILAIVVSNAEFPPPRCVCDLTRAASGSGLVTSGISRRADSPRRHPPLLFSVEETGFSNAPHIEKVPIKFG